MTTGNSSDPASAAGASAASAAQSTDTTTTTPAASAAAPAATPDAAAPGTFTPPGAEGAAVTPPAYTPNYKYNIMGKEHEVDEFWRGLIKDADSEKKVKDLFTKTQAFDEVKASRESLQTEYQSVRGEFDALDRDVRRVMSFLNAGDLDNFFGSLKIPENKVYDWVAKRLEAAQNPEALRSLESQAQERARAFDLEQERSSLEHRYQEQAVQARATQLDLMLSRPDISAAASAWDSRAGQVGAFRDLIISEAQNAYFTQNQDLSAEQAVSMVMQKYGKFLGDGTQPQVVTPQAPAPGTAAPQVAAKPVIPAVQGRGTSPIKKSPKSLDDLRQMAKELQT